MRTLSNLQWLIPSVSIAFPSVRSVSRLSRTSVFPFQTIFGAHFLVCGLIKLCPIHHTSALAMLLLVLPAPPPPRFFLQVDSTRQRRYEGRDLRFSLASSSSVSIFRGQLSPSLLVIMAAVSAPAPIVSPVPESFYPLLAVLLLTIGLVTTASFFIYEVTTSKFNRSLLREFTTGGVASVFLGFGTLFLMLWTGLYV